MSIWNHWSADQILHEKLPLGDIVSESLYYPSSRFDGLPVKAMSKEVQRFVYVDYGPSEFELEAELADTQRGFIGYHIVASRTVRQDELAPPNWTPPPLQPRDGDPRRAIAPGQNRPFAKWAVLERNPDSGDHHGPSRFSLLYICGDGAATYDAVYTSNRYFAKYLAIIQPGHGFGFNYTDFENRSLILGRLVMDDNPAGKPEFLLFGGLGEPAFYGKPCWPEFSQFVRILTPNGTVRLWRIPV